MERDHSAFSDSWLGGPLPLFGTLSDAEYADLGFRCGLEIHQQLLTRRKLFCRCPAGVYNQGEHQAEVLRHMRPTLSEMGEYDGTALMEFKTRKDIIYHLNKDTVCTYEMDDAPPFEMDDQALDISIAITMLLGCNVVSEVHITRKQYLDGSIPTGFQRTAIIGTDGDIPCGEKSIHIRQLSIEEDSCREVSDAGHVRTYRTDRLGMPLIESVTDPDMTTPREAMAVGQVLRHLVRATGLVRTGSGAARQDVNVSVTGGTRIEIKGVPCLRAIPRLTHNEALRQRTLVAIARELEHRGAKPGYLPQGGNDVTSAVRGTACRFIGKAVEKGATVMAVPLPGFQGLLQVQTQPRTGFLKEFSDRIRVIACLDTLPNLVMSTQDVPTLSSGEWERVAKTCRVGPEVPIILVWGSERDAATAVSEVLIRAREAFVGVPEETRQALDDGTNGFERVLPGADRMYPDTDLPPIGLSDERLEHIHDSLPLTPWKREDIARTAGVGPDLAARLGRHRAWDLFAALLPILQESDTPALTASQLASLLLDRSCPRPLQTAAAGPWWADTVRKLVSGDLIPEGVWSAESEPLEPWPREKARAAVEDLLQAIPAGELPESPLQRDLVLMGRVMPGVLGRVPGRTVR
ncbi:Glu-tRNA(Gln) amidotransferase GatDE subunit E, partial [bacterium CG17_big_fil_post_rev_8_21_14_2_50_64_8]